MMLFNSLIDVKKTLESLANEVLSMEFKLTWTKYPDEERLGSSYVKTYFNGINEALVSLNDGSHEIFKGMKEDDIYTAIYGIGIHELLHLTLSDSNALRGKVRCVSADKLQLFALINNTFEDGRIEHFAADYFDDAAIAALCEAKRITWKHSPKLDVSAGPLCFIVCGLIQYGDMGRIKGNISDLKPEDAKIFNYCIGKYDEAIRCSNCKDCVEIVGEITDCLFEAYMNK